jgi:ATP adenylyltransferase/5',5'''-P-1,P-4-tetraphosphate phosphorylase II
MSKDILTDFFYEQLKSWELLNSNVKNLDTIRTKKIRFNNTSIVIQYNEARKASANAKIDKESLQSRACFLCKENRPNEQMELLFSKELTILTNPFPIFNRHFTIVSTKHENQKFLSKLGYFLELAKVYQNFDIVYNGPKCGASAPDHMHFQAGEKNFMPFDTEVIELFNHNSEKVQISEGIVLKAIHAKDYLRNLLVFKSNSKEKLTDWFIEAYNIIIKYYTEDEPMMNLICFYKNNNWYLSVFLRDKHRPQQFFAKDDTRIMTSPGVVDFGGVFPMVREEDFNKVNKEIIEDIFSQLTINTMKYRDIIEELKNTDF